MFDQLQLSPTDIGVTATAILGIGSAIYALYDKLMTRWEIAESTRVKREAEQAKTAADAWRDFAAERKQQHEKDVSELKAEIADNRKEIRQLNQRLAQVSGLEQQISGLKEENEQMKTAFRRMGMWPDDDMPPWLPGMPDRRDPNNPGSGRWYVGPERRKEGTDKAEPDKPTV